MKVVTESELRDIYMKAPFTSFDLPSGMKLTPAASQFLSERKIKVLRDGVPEAQLVQENRCFNISAPTPQYPKQPPTPNPLANNGGSGGMYQQPIPSRNPIQNQVTSMQKETTAPIFTQDAYVPPVPTKNQSNFFVQEQQAPIEEPKAVKNPSVAAYQPEVYVPPVATKNQPQRAEDASSEQGHQSLATDTTAQNMDRSHVSKEKPEHMTHLRGSTLVPKTHPMIAFRGQLDVFEAVVLKGIIESENSGFKDLASDLGEMLKVSRSIMRAEVRQEPMEPISICGWNADQIRERSHYPNKFYNVNHFTPQPEHGKVMADLNYMRAIAREMELAAAHAFIAEDGTTERDDILQAVNRFSSVIYVFMVQLLAGVYKYGC